MLLIILGLVSLINSGCGDSEGSYGKIIKYSQNKPIKYPDFQIEFTGESDKTMNFDNGNKFTFHYYNFKVTSASAGKEIQWTSGTGDLAPLPFDFGTDKYSLELKYSEASNKMIGNDELVVTKLPKN